MSSHRIDMKDLIISTQSCEQNDQATKRYRIAQSRASLMSFRKEGALKLVAEWQERGLETLSGHTFRKLRLAFAQPESVIAASVAG
jgi:hypothetical protein